MMTGLAAAIEEDYQSALDFVGAGLPAISEGYRPQAGTH